MRDAQVPAETLIERISRREAVIGVVGLGYVGLPLALEFHRGGFRVLGLDVDPAKVEALRAGRSYILHIPGDRIASMMASGHFTPTTDYSMARDCDAIILCVPTPLTRHREPDMTYVEGTCASLAPHLRRGQLISLESTTYPGTTAEVVIPTIAQGSSLNVECDLLFAYSPEREDPSNKQFSTATIPKVVGGRTPQALDAAMALYGAIVQETVPVRSCEIAEAAKLVENIFRSVNIAMVNELKIVFDRMGIDVWEVIDAAKTKPFGYMPFYPGPGLGGHCIPIDPFYLTWKAREFDVPTKFIELAGEINTLMPYYVVQRTMEVLSDLGHPLRGARLLLLGLAYKPDVDDERESPTFKLMDLFEERGAAVVYHDPHVPVIKPTREHGHRAGMRSVGLENVGDYDAVIISTAHSAVDYKLLADQARLIIDTRNAMARRGLSSGKIHKA